VRRNGNTYALHRCHNLIDLERRKGREKKKEIFIIPLGTPQCAPEAMTSSIFGRPMRIPKEWLKNHGINEAQEAVARGSHMYHTTEDSDLRSGKVMMLRRQSLRL
jgi:hypothetical protein